MFSRRLAKAPPEMWPTRAQRVRRDATRRQAGAVDSGHAESLRESSGSTVNTGRDGHGLDAWPPRKPVASACTRPDGARADVLDVVDPQPDVDLRPEGHERALFTGSRQAMEKGHGSRDGENPGTRPGTLQVEIVFQPAVRWISACGARVGPCAFGVGALALCLAWGWRSAGSNAQICQTSSIGYQVQLRGGVVDSDDWFLVGLTLPDEARGETVLRPEPGPRGREAASE